MYQMVLTLASSNSCLVQALLVIDHMIQLCCVTLCVTLIGIAKHIMYVCISIILRSLTKYMDLF